MFFFFRGVKYESYKNLLTLTVLILRVTLVTIAFWENMIKLKNVSL